MSPRLGVYVPTATRRRLVAVIGVMAVAMGADGCPGGNGGPTAQPNPAPMAMQGEIEGNVSVDGVPQGGSGVDIVPVTSTGTGSTAQTDAFGDYLFSTVEPGLWDVKLATLPPDVVWEETIVNLNVAGDGATELADFMGRRTLTGTFTGTMEYTSGNAAHDQFVFRSLSPTAADLVIARMAPDQIEVSGPGLGPSPLPPLLGTFDPVTGDFDATATGTIAGFPDVQIDINGPITGPVGDPKQAVLTVTLGAAGGLPGGQPITYLFDGILEDQIPVP